MANKKLTTLTKEDKENVLSHSPYALPDNPSNKNFSASQIKSKMYEGYLVLYDYIERAINEGNEVKDEIYEKIKNGSGSGSFNTIFVQSIDLNRDTFGFPTRTLTINSFPISDTIIEKIELGKVAIRLNYAGRAHKNYDGECNHGYRYANSFWCNYIGEEGYYLSPRIQFLKRNLLIITKEDIKTNGCGDKYISKTLDLAKFINDNVFNFEESDTVPSLRPLEYGEAYLYSQSIFHESILPDGKTGLFYKRNAGRGVENKTDKNYSPLSVCYELRGTPFCFPLLGNLTSEEIETGITELHALKEDGVVFPMSYEFTNAERSLDPIDIVAGGLYSLREGLVYSVNRNHGGAIGIGVNIMFGDRKKTTKFLTTRFTPSFCILKDDYENEKTYMYEAVFPKYEKKVVMKFATDYYLPLEDGRYTTPFDGFSFMVKCQIK